MAYRLSFDGATSIDPTRQAPGGFIYRLARRLETYSLAAAPEQLALIEGLRAATAVSAVVALAVWLGRPSLTWAAFGAFWICLVDPGGPDRRRLACMAGFALSGTFAAFVSALAGAAGPVAGGGALLALVFLAGLLGTYGPAAAQVGTLAAVVAVVAVEFPQTPHGALIQSATFLSGTIWAQLLCVGVWRIHPHAMIRRSLGAVYLHLADMLADLSRLDQRNEGASDWERSRAENRRAVRAAIERARTCLLSFTSGVERYRGELDTADRIFAALVAAGHERAARGAALCGEERELLAQLMRLLAEMREQTARRTPRPKALAPQAAELLHAASRVGTATGRVIAVAAQALADQAAAWLNGTAARTADETKPQNAAAVIRPVPAATLYHAARLAIAVTAAYGIVAMLGVKFSYWATMSTVVVVQPMAATTWMRGLERSLGSIAGGLLAALLVLIAPAPLALLPAVFPVATATIAFKRVNYTLFVVCVSCLFILVAELLLPAAGIPAIRAINSVIGSLVGAATLFLWPDAEDKSPDALLAEAVTANLALAAQAMDGNAAAFDAARRAAGLASTAAETSCHRLALAGQSRRLHLSEAAALLAALRALAGAALVRALAGPDDDVQSALRRVGKAKAAYAAARAQFTDAA